MADIIVEHGGNIPQNGVSIKDLISRNIPMGAIVEKFPFLKEVKKDLLESVETEIKYAGYLEKQNRDIERAKKLEEKLLPKDIDYNKIEGLRLEARQKLNEIRPLNLGQAGRISGVNPADVAVLMVWLKK